MKFLVDAQLPPGLCRWLKARRHSALHVAGVMSGETPDHEVAGYAATHDLILISKDEDFLTRYPPIDYRLVWVRIGNATNRALALDAGERLVEVR